MKRIIYVTGGWSGRREYWERELELGWGKGEYFRTEVKT